MLHCVERVYDSCGIQHTLCVATVDEAAAMQTQSDASGILTCTWLADSGCSTHMTGQAHYLHDYKQLINPIPIRLGDNHSIHAIGQGKLKTSKGIINDVYLVPQVETNLFSIGHASTYNESRCGHL